MKLQAASTGYAVPRGSFSAVLHSVFESAVNLRVFGMETLITILVSDNTDLPQGIRIRLADGFSTRGLIPGQKVICRNGVLSLGGEIPQVDLRTAPVWNGKIKALDFDASRASNRAAWQAAFDALMDEKKAIPSSQLQGDLPERHIEEALNRLTFFSHRFDLQNAKNAAAALVGLGPGLTPAGDDVLVGFMAGLRTSGVQDSARVEFTSRFGTLLGEISRRTNDISRTYLILAAQGQFSSSIIVLAGALCAGADRQIVRAAAGNLFKTGHTSGMDAAAGLLAGMSVWA